MKLIKKIKSLDNSEKDFLLLGLAFILLVLFFLFTGFLKNDLIQSSSKIYFGYSETDIDLIEINEIQRLSCEYANQFKTCNKIDETLIITSEICCKKLELCCI